MREMSEAARQRLDAYLGEVKVCLKGTRSVDTAEVERDITEHIEQELASIAGPVDVEAIEGVLVRLGSPQQWVPVEELSLFRKLALRLRTGPDDWRLAYITIGTFVLACVTGPAALVLLPLSFYFARATLSVAGGLGHLGNQRYLLYPPLACMYVVLTGVVLALPLLLVNAADMLEGYRQQWGLYDDLQYWLFAWSLIAVVAGAWWLLVAFLSLKRAAKVYYPLKAAITRKIVLLVCILGAVLIVAGIVGKIIVFGVV